MNALFKWVADRCWPHRDETPHATEADFRVGEYVADYSEITSADVTQTDPELDRILQNSKPL